MRNGWKREEEWSLTGFGRVEGRRRNFAVSQTVRRGPGAAILSLPRESQGPSFFEAAIFCPFLYHQNHNKLWCLLRYTLHTKGCRSYHTMASISTLAAQINSVIMRYEDIQISKLATSPLHSTWPRAHDNPSPLTTSRLPLTQWSFWPVVCKTSLVHPHLLPVLASTSELFLHPKTKSTSSSRKRVEAKFQGSPELDEWMDGVVLLTKCCWLVGRGA